MDKKNKKGFFGNLVAIILIIIFCLIIVILFFTLKNNPPKNLEDICKDNLKQFNYTFYKVDYVDGLGGGNYYCWGINNNTGEPVNIGTVVN